MSDISKNMDRYYSKLDSYQRAYYGEIFSKSVVCVDAPAGTGKTTIAIMAALQLLYEGKINHIYYVRFPDDRSLKLGYIPGDTREKQEMYMYPFYDACYEFGLSTKDIEEMIQNEDVILQTDITMRGTNIQRSIVIIDEGQNGHFSDLKLVLTRVHDDCKCVLIGHSGQYDNFRGKNENAFVAYIDHLTKKNWAVKCDLPINYRGKISSWADKLEM